MENLEIYQAKTRRLFAIAAIIFSSLFGVGFIINSSWPANADTAPNTINDAGRYQMGFQCVYNPANESTYFYTLVWDNTTGRSKLYYGSTYTKRVDAAAQNFQLPGSPL